MKKEFKKSFDNKEDRNKKPSDKPSFKKDFKKEGDRPFRGDKKNNGVEEKSFGKKFPERKKRDNGFGKEKSFEKKPFSRSKEEGDKPRFGDKREGKFSNDRDKFADRKFGKKNFEKKEGEEGDRRERRFDKNKFSERKFDKKPFEKSEKKPFGKTEGKPSFEKRDKKPFEKKERREGERKFDKPDRKRFDKKREDDFKENAKPEKKDTSKSIDEPMMLNKYIAHSGECSRRDAAELVKQGKVRVNGELILEPGHRVAPGDTVTLSGKKMTPQKNLVYVLLNKPKDYITTTEDPQERKTVMDLVANAEVDRLYPVGRLDRNTTGLLLLTNDGALAHKLSHPSYNIRKVYHVTLDKKLTKADYDKIFKGLELEDGKVQVDEIAYLEERHEVGVEIHSGRNRIVRRIFESLGYTVEKLDRVIYAGLTKKNLPRGKWRFLDEKEIIFLKHFKN